MKDMALEVITKYRLFTICDIMAYVPFSQRVFYNKGLNEDKDILNAIDKNKIITKNAILKKWHDGNNVTAQLLLFRVCASKEERDLLVYERHEITGANGTPLIPTDISQVDTTNLSNEEKAILLKVARKNGFGKG